MSAEPTPSQTVGPFFSLGLTQGAQNELVASSGQSAVWIRGRVIDGAGDGVPDGMVEAFSEGRWGRCGTGEDGGYSLRLTVPASTDEQAPHVALLVFARGLLKPVLTRVYLPDRPEAHGADPVLAALDEAQRAGLVAAVGSDGLHFDIRLQGPGQTTFFAQ